MANRAVELFTATPRQHNCAQSVACGLGHDELSAELANCGGGRAPGGRCGALHAAMLIRGGAEAEEISGRFVRELGSDKCAELKRVFQVPCARCVETAALLAEENPKQP